MNRIDRNIADGEVFIEVLIGRDVAAAGAQAHFDVELAALADGGDVQVPVEHFDVGIGLDLAREDVAGTIDAEANGLDALAHDLERDLLQVEDDVGGVFDNAGDGAEFVVGAFDAHGGDGGSFDRAEEYAAESVTDGGAESPLEGLGGEHAIPFREGLGIGHQPLWFLEAFEHSFLPLTCYRARR